LRVQRTCWPFLRYCISTAIAATDSFSFSRTLPVNTHSSLSRSFLTTDLFNLREARNRLIFLKENDPEFLDRVIDEIQGKEIPAERLRNQPFYDFMARALLGIQPLRKSGQSFGCPECGEKLVQDLTIRETRFYCMRCLRKSKRARWEFDRDFEKRMLNRVLPKWFRAGPGGPNH